jgi:hypothetical protein
MFPNLKSKKFLDVSTNKPVVVKDQFENIAILDNNQRVDVKRLLDKSYYDDYIDPSSFFDTSNLQIFAEKIKSIPNEALQNMKDDDSPIITSYDPEEEKRILEKKAREMYSQPNTSVMSQIDKFKGMIDEDELPNIPTPTTNVVNTVSTNQNNVNQVQVNQPVQNNQSDPMINMFRNIKRNTDFKISIDIENKIPRPDFIEMMEDSYEVSIIDYLSDEFTKAILSDTSIIRDKIKEAIRDIVYNKKVSEKKEIPNVPEEKKEKLNEGVEKKTKRTSRKPAAPKDREIKEGQEPEKPNVN